jgi:hypothetical protein
MKNNTQAKTMFAVPGIDTAAVLFLLAFEYARSIRVFETDGILMSITMAMVLVLPYFLPSNWSRVSFGGWMISRSLLMLAGLATGAAFGMSVGTVLPKSMALMPMTFLILAGMVSAYVQFYGLFKLRTAK